MDKNSSSLSFRHISNATEEIVKYIDDRRKGNIKSLKTKWDKFNKLCMGGIEPNSIYTVAGISGAGKSAFANSLETDLFEQNPNEDFVVLSFNFEMLSSKQVGRKLSYKLERSTQELYSANEKLSDKEYQKIVEESKSIKDYPIYYVDIPGDVDQIKNTIKAFQNLDNIKDKWVIIILDHTLLTKNKTGEKERETLANLQYMFMEMKKYDKNTIIQLSQINREIESHERILNKMLHFPVRRDIFGGDSVFQASDYLIVLHRPEILNISSYGPQNWPVKDLVYLHFLKIREGSPSILVFKNNLKYNRLDDISTNFIKNN